MRHRRAGNTVLRVLGASGTILLVAVAGAAVRVPVAVSGRLSSGLTAFHAQGSGLVPSGRIGAAGFGVSLALSTDGNTAAIGGSGDNRGRGAVWIFTRSGSAWTQQAKLTAQPEGEDSFFGDSVALSSDGNTLLAGAPGDHFPFGAAWVFTRSGSTWTQQGGKLAGKGARLSTFNYGFGSAVTLSGDGNLALVASPNDDQQTGAFWTFVRTGTTWKRSGGKFVAPDAVRAGESFGYSIAVSADGSTAAAGVSEDNGSGIILMVRKGSRWKQVAGYSGVDSNGVALSSDGGIALTSDGDNGPGAAYMLVRTPSGWRDGYRTLIGHGDTGFRDEAYSDSGTVGEYGVALSADGKTALVTGAIGQGKLNQGVVWVFRRQGPRWKQSGQAIRPMPPVSEPTVALSGDGHTALIGSGGPRVNVLTDLATP